MTISVKAAHKVYCFLCGHLHAKMDSLEKYSVPICSECGKGILAQYYTKKVVPTYAKLYLMNPPIKRPKIEICEYRGKEYLSDILFEDYGFCKKVSPEFLIKPEINIELCDKFIQPIWRKRGF